MYQYTLISTFSLNITIFIILIVINAIEQYSPQDEHWSNILITILLVSSILCVYTFLLYRISKTFDGTMYQVNTKLLYLHSINMFIMAAIFITDSIFDYDGDIIYSYLSVVFILTLLIIGYGHLLYTFNHNLFLLVLSQRQTVVNPTLDIELNQRQIKLLRTIRKHSILAFYMLLTSLTMIITFLLVSFMGYDENISITNRNIIWGIHILNVAAFLNIGPLCIYLGFEINKNFYQKMWGLCDRKCDNICTSLAENRLRLKQRPELVQSSSQ